MTIANVNSEPPMWDLLWERADLPDAHRDQWRAVMSYRSKLPDDAEILAAYDWTPADVLAARTDPSLYWPDMHEHWSKRLDDDPAADGDAGRRRAALMALAEETARYHDSRASLAREIRMQYMLDLARRLPKEQRWSHEKVGLVLSLTKQRVQQILRNAGKYTRDPNMPVALVPGQGSMAVEVVTEARRRKLSRIFGPTR
ncbi:hypothetical protein LJR044_003736 [Microbacterium foliorum]